MSNTQSMKKSEILGIAQRAINEAVKVANGELGFAYNLAHWGPTMGRPNAEVKADPEAAELARRFSSWIPRLARSETCRRLRRLVKVCAGSGMNSPTNTINMWTMVARYSTPEEAAVRLRQIESGARIALAPFAIVPSNEALAAELQGYESPTVDAQAGQFAARTTLEDLLFRRFGLKRAEAMKHAMGIREAIAEPFHLRLWIGDRLAAGEFGNITEALEAKGRLIRIEGSEAPIFLDPASTQKFRGIEFTAGWGDKSGWAYSDRAQSWYSRPGSQPVIHLPKGGGYLPVRDWSATDTQEARHIEGPEAIFWWAMRKMPDCLRYRTAYDVARMERNAAEAAEKNRQIEVVDKFLREMGDRITLKLNWEHSLPNIYVDGKWKLLAGFDGGEFRKFLDSAEMMDTEYPVVAVWKAVAREEGMRDGMLRGILSLEECVDERSLVGDGA